MSLVAYFREVWPFESVRNRVLGEYRQLGDLKYLLTDIGLRGGVYSKPRRTPGDIFGDGINEGRRQLANEIITLAGARAIDLVDLIPKSNPKGGS